MLTSVLNGIMKHIYTYGCVLSALATTLLSGIMNSDPKIVYDVYNSGLAATIFRMIKGNQFGALEKRMTNWMPR